MVVVDETLLETVDVTAGLKEEGAIVINSERPAAELWPLLHDYKGRVFTVDAGAISRKHLGAYFPNTPMLAAIVAVSHCVDPEDFLRVSNGVIVALRHIRSIKPALSMRFALTLSDGRRADVTRSCYYAFKEALGI